MHSAVFRAWCQLQRRCPLEDAEFCCVCGAFGFHAARQSSSSLTHATSVQAKGARSCALANHTASFCVHDPSTTCWRVEVRAWRR